MALHTRGAYGTEKRLFPVEWIVYTSISYNLPYNYLLPKALKLSVPLIIVENALLDISEDINKTMIVNFR
jgi:hypothetical protein